VTSVFPGFGAVGIKFPGMEVDNDTFAVIFLKFAEDPVSIRKWEYPQVAPPATGRFCPRRRTVAGGNSSKEWPSFNRCLYGKRRAPGAHHIDHGGSDRCGVVCKPFFSEVRPRPKRQSLVMDQLGARIAKDFEPAASSYLEPLLAYPHEIRQASWE